MNTLEDSLQKEWIIRLKEGDELAFTELYKVYSKPLYLRVLRMVKDADTADDLLQEIFIKLWNSRESLDTEKSFKSFMYTIAQNVVYNHFRKVSSDQSLVEELLKNANEYVFNPQKLLENKQTAEILQDAIDQLSPQRKQAFTLCKIEGRSYEEAAKIMGISTATVNSHITKSTQLVKEFILKNQDVLLFCFVLESLVI